MAKIINMFCGGFNGYITVKIKDKILKFELVTPQYSGIGCFEVSTNFEIYVFIRDGKVPSCINQNISLSSADEDWWLNLDHSEEDRYKVCGGINSKKFCVFDYDNFLVPFENINFQGVFARDSFDKLMFQLLKIFYDWYKNPSFKATTNELYF